MFGVERPKQEAAKVQAAAKTGPEPAHLSIHDIVSDLKHTMLETGLSTQ